MPCPIPLQIAINWVVSYIKLPPVDDHFFRGPRTTWYTWLPSAIGVEEAGGELRAQLSHRHREGTSSQHPRGQWRSMVAGDGVKSWELPKKSGLNFFFPMGCCEQDRVQKGIVHLNEILHGPVPKTSEDDRPLTVRCQDDPG